MENNCSKTIDKSFDIQSNIFRIPKNQACKNIGVDCWDCECPYPYGNKELNVTCKMCSTDLKMYKLVN